MGTMLSAAAWGPDTIGLGRALDAVRDSVERIDGFLGGRGGGRVAAVDSLRRDVRQRTGVSLAAHDVAAGYALDRAALALAGVADSAILDLDGQFLWVGPPPRPTRRAVGIPDPYNSLRPLATVELWSGSVRSTSPPRGQQGRARAVTVLAPTAIAADAWSLAFLAIGCDSALALAPRLEHWRVSVVCADSAGVRWTADLDKRVLLPTGTGEGPAPAP